MKVEKIIEALKRNYKPDQELFATWWSEEDFKGNIPKGSTFSDVCELLEDKMDWSDANDAMINLIENRME